MGVKSLWQLLTPVGRPVMLETAEGKAMAIDSSIWIYQFQATMRDKDGRALVNAHVLGFLRRICKLLFYGIKPVFVFDGGAPALKRSTITERKKKKSGAAATHARVAERLLAAQLRREAVSHAQGAQSPSTPKASKGKDKAPSGPVLIDENAVYLEDIDGSVPKTPAKKTPKGKPSDPSSTSSKKNRFYEHDPYRLPDVNMDDVVAKATQSTAPDPRLATEEELRTFIEDMRPEDFDVTSPAFRELPTEVQYEIVGDLRLKSRQTSYTRLQNMLKHAPTPLDFSRQQILNLKQRNSLTQQLLITTDSIGKAHVSIPIRIASERNREYVLIKNEGIDGGWVLGIRDEGTQAKPIQIDQDSNGEVGDDESDVEMEEVAIPQEAVPDSDLREYRRGMALSAIAQRSTEKNLAPLTTRPIHRRPKARPLFDLAEDEIAERPATVDDSDDDMELAYVIAQSLETQQDPAAGESSEAVLSHPPSSKSSPTASKFQDVPGTPPSTRNKVSANPTTPRLPKVSPESRTRFQPDDIDLYEASPSRLETALSIANAAPPRRPISRLHEFSPQNSVFGKPSLLMAAPSPSLVPETVTPDSDKYLDEVDVIPQQMPSHSSAGRVATESKLATTTPPHESSPEVIPSPETDSDEDMEEIGLPLPVHRPTRLQGDTERVSVPMVANHTTEHPVVAITLEEGTETAHEALRGLPQPSYDQPPDVDADALAGSEDDWPRSPSPIAALAGTDNFQQQPGDDWDAAQEMDPYAEEGEFARFMSQVKGKDLDSVRREIDDEIKSLNQQKKAAMRDSEDITQQMISQIMLMLRLFGIPYITAPMEAEAQCAELVSLGLVEGIITDDSDVFLFGGLRVYKNMFNQSKTVECFLLSDLSRELGLERDTLVRLAYLLGSDYVEGLPGVGPVVAMELLKEFPGEDGLHKFKDWWSRVQTGKDRPGDTDSKFKKRFKKKFKDLYLPPDWPNAAVRDAYYHPTVDSSEEPFKWGLPDLDALRDFFHDELGWNQTKVDDLLLPIIQKMGKRGQAAALNKQGNLNDFFDVTAGNGTYAPRKRQAYASKRLQQVVTDFRSEQAKSKAGPSTTPDPSRGEGSDSGNEKEGPPRKKTKTAGKGKSRTRTGSSGTTGMKAGGRGRGRGKGRGRGARKSSTTGRKGAKAEQDSVSEEDEYLNREGGRELEGDASPPLAKQLRPRPKPTYKGKRVDSASNSQSPER